MNHFQAIETALPGIVFRSEIKAKDPERIRHIVRVTGYFSDEEVAVAEELVSERLRNGPACGYQFLLAEHDGRLSGYTCYGLIPCTAGSYDLYWIAVHPDLQRCGLGRCLMLETESRIKADGGARVYVETSQRVQYASTRTFYESLGYRLETVLMDFYAPGDGKAIYSRKLV